VQRLADIDVAKTRDHALVEQRRLQVGLLAGAGTGQQRGVELIAQRLGAESFQERLLLDLRPPHDLHVAEATRIVERDDRTARHVKDDVIMRAIVAARMMEHGRLLIVCAFGDAK
jgi:hypothetical protein